jgi:YgiT-type zinc finger domain-containing protein
MMAGKKENQENRICPLCGGLMSDGLTTLPSLMEERIVVIKDVPAEICGDCGEAYLSSSVARKVESLLDKVEELQSEMSVIHYHAA